MLIDVLVERLLRWMREVNAMDRLRLHFVGQGAGDRLFRQAFLKDTQRAWDALLAYAWGQQQRRSDLSVEICLRQAGFDVSEFGALDDLILAQQLEQMRRLGGRRDLVPFVVLDGQVVVSGAGLARVETIFYQMHPEFAKKDRNVDRP
ncbi:MAG: hypothetical protein HOH77_15460 [Candidatus Latescibacteria bacterium]|nr:hypothetical protein [Candidatus Latescibacterota bacterium]